LNAKLLVEGPTVTWKVTVFKPGHRLVHVADLEDSAPRTTKRRQAKRNSLADKLAVETKVLVDLKVGKAAVEGGRRMVAQGDQKAREARDVLAREMSNAQIAEAHAMSMRMEI